LVVAALPTFSVAEIIQTTPVAGQSNVITVALRANTILTAGTLVTITGLTGSQTADTAAGNSFVFSTTTNAFSTQGTWTRTDGKLVLTVGSATIVTGSNSVATFTLQNSASAQESPAVSVQVAAGTAVAMTKPFSNLNGVTNGANPLLTVVPTFTTRIIAQSKPVISAPDNVITVTLVANVNVGAGTVITISGLAGATDAGTVTLTGTDSSRFSKSGGATASEGALAAGVLTLKVLASNDLTAGQTYTFAFTVTNPSTPQGAQTITITASGTSLPSFAAAQGLMTSPGTPLLGVQNGYAPLLVVAAVPVFRVRTIGQSTPVAGATNTITVTLTAGSTLAPGSTVTISGLTGSQTADATSLAVVSSLSVLEATGDWKQSTGTLVLTTGRSVIAQDVQLTASFTLMNPAAAQASPAVNVSATLAGGGGANPAVAMTKTGTALFGVPNGYDPLLVAVPAFSVKSIQQSTTVAGATNTFTVTLTANYNLAASSKVTITGLTGSQTADSASLAVTSSPSVLEPTGDWKQTTGTLVLTAASQAASGTAYVVTFTLTNSATAQSSPAVSVSATLAGVGSIPVAAMTKPGSDPLLVTVPASTVQMKVELPYTKADFDATAQAKFKSAVASAGSGSTPVENIFIKSVTEVTSRRVSRKLLAVSVQVDFYIVVKDEAAGKAIASSGNLEMEKLNTEIVKQVLR
jgi:hypothetical protein